jgi:threonine dehydratase
VEAYGADISFCEPTLAAREAAAVELLRSTGGTLVHPYDDDRVIAGQGTAALEFLEEIPDLDIICAPVSGGGLLSGHRHRCKIPAPGNHGHRLRAG